MALFTAAHLSVLDRFADAWPYRYPVAALYAALFWWPFCAASGRDVSPLFCPQDHAAGRLGTEVSSRSTGT
jgi:hypothetical protein